MKQLLRRVGAGDAVEVVRSDSRRLKTRLFDNSPRRDLHPAAPSPRSPPSRYTPG